MSLTLTKLKKYAVFMRQGIALLLALLLLTGCAPAEPSESALHNFSGLLHQCSQLALQGSEMWIAGANGLRVCDAGTRAPLREVALPDGLQTPQGMFWQDGQLLIRDGADGKVWRFDPSTGAAEPIPETLGCSWFFVAGNALYHSGGMLHGSNEVWRLQNGIHTLVLDRAPQNTASLCPTESALYFTDVATQRLCVYDYAAETVTELTQEAVAQPVVCGGEVYYRSGGTVYRLSDGQAVLQEVRYLFRGGDALYYDRGSLLYRWDGQSSTLLSSEPVASVETAAGWLRCQTRDGRELWISKRKK